MKCLSALVAFVFFSTTLFAQTTTIKGDNLQTEWRTQTFNLVYHHGVEPGGEGPNQTWDFQDMEITENQVQKQVGKVMRYDGSFVDMKDIEVAEVKNTKGCHLQQPMEEMALYSPVVPGEVKYKFTEDLNELGQPYYTGRTNVANNFYNSRYYQPRWSYYRIQNPINFEVVGCGQLTMPFGEYEAVKVKITNYRDKWSGGCMVYRVENHEDFAITYAWFVQGHPQPVLAIDLFGVENNVLDTAYVYHKVVRASQPQEKAAPQVVDLGVEALVYPNPSNGTSFFNYTLPEDVETVQLTILDANGSEVDALYKGSQMAGRHSVGINTSKLPTGLYNIRLALNDHVVMKKLLVQ